VSKGSSSQGSMRLKTTRSDCWTRAARARSLAPSGVATSVFPHLSAAGDFGGDYHLEVWLDGEEILSKPEYVPVNKGARTFVVLRWQPLEKGLPDTVVTIRESIGQFSLLESVLERMTPNPGWHVGVVSVRGSGPQTLFSTRYLVKPPVRDRSPQLVSAGTMRLECLTPETSEDPGSFGYPKGVHYLRIVLLGHATEADLDLASRPTIETPWGVGIGVVPSADPTLYTIGPSYKLTRGVELVAGVAIQQDHSTSFVYGVTVDLDDVLDAIFGRAGREGW